MSVVVTVTIWEESVEEVNEPSTLRSRGGGCEDKYWQGAAEEHIMWQLCFYASVWFCFELSAVIINIMKSARNERVKADLKWKASGNLSVGMKGLKQTWSEKAIREPVSGNEADLKWKSIREPVSGNERVKADLKWKSNQGTSQWEWREEQTNSSSFSSCSWL